MSYPRVIPRDLFNESKLLKCLGRLALIIHDGGAPRGVALTLDAGDVPGFQIEQDQSSGALYCANLELTHGGRLIGLRSPYNNREPWPLLWVLGDDEGPVFDASGTLSPEFLAMLERVQPANDPKVFTVFKRSAKNWEQFARGRKITIERNLTRSEAARCCERLNAGRTAAQKRRGTVYEFTS